MWTDVINKCFDHSTVEEIINALIREGRYQTFEQCLLREYRMTVKAISRQVSNDFCEGVRMRLVDKSFSPKWDPPSLEQVSEDMVDAYFAPLTRHEPELEFPYLLQKVFA
ncbi:conserved hypothetical protein [Ricinus communis]|uniref:3-hydroxyisobutyryl-CoA hydrolase n=1 Tax=Ricinus communis TaxID=3988 RepID=B9SXD5_RICCO|nr:conserved hypothetical protein [Ricinus communis]